MASILRVRDDCGCAKGGGRKHKVFRIRPYLGRDAAGRQQFGRSRTLHGSKREANRLAHEVDQEIAAGRARAPRSLTLAVFLEQWMGDEVAATTQPRTQADYRRLVDRHLKPVLGAVPLRSLTVQHVMKLRNAILSRPSPRTGEPPRSEAAHAIAALRSALTHAAHMNLIANNVARGVKVKTKRAQQPVRYDRRVIQQVFRAVDRTEIGALVQFVIRTGVRRGEAVALRWDDVDLRTRWVRVHRSMQRISGHGLVFDETKTVSSDRPVRLDIRLAKILRRHREAQDENRATLGRGYRGEGLVFCWADGRPWDPDNVAKRYRRILDEHGLPRLTLRALRHAFATLAQADGASVREVQAQLGHASPAYTLSIYTDHHDHIQAAMVDRYGATLDEIDEQEVDDLLTDESGQRREKSA